MSNVFWKSKKNWVAIIYKYLNIIRVKSALSLTTEVHIREWKMLHILKSSSEGT
jgi:hypothetical protein